MTWQDQASCHPDRRPEGWTLARWVRQWYPDHGGAPPKGYRFCAVCPVQADCLAAGVSETEGIWGGVAAEARVSLRSRDLSPIEHGTARGYRAHRRRGEDPCVACRDARRSAAANAARERKYRRVAA